MSPGRHDQPQTVGSLYQTLHHTPGQRYVTVAPTGQEGLGVAEHHSLDVDHRDQVLQLLEISEDTSPAVLVQARPLGSGRHRIEEFLHGLAVLHVLLDVSEGLYHAVLVEKATDLQVLLEHLHLLLHVGDIVFQLSSAGVFLEIN